MATVKEPRKEYTDKLPGVLRNRAAIEGERAVKKAGVTYLAPLASMCVDTAYNDDGTTTLYKRKTLTDEGAADYQKYIDNAYFYPAAQRTLEGLLGLIFAKKPTKELASNISYLEENADGCGTSLRDMSKLLCRETNIAPWSGLLVARPPTPEGFSEKDVEDSNLKAKLLPYAFESIITWDYGIENNVKKLSLVILKESKTVRDGYKVESETQYRVLELKDGIYHQSLYDDKDQPIESIQPVIVNGSTLTEIPFYFIDAQDGENAPLDALVDANFQQYKLYADYGGKLHLSSFIIYTETGADSGNNLMIGNGVKWNNNNPEAKFGILQPDGNADAHRLALADMKENMAELGAEQLKARVSGPESAEAKSLDKVAQNSTTANVAITVSEVIQKALKMASLMMGNEQESIYLLNTDYNPTGMDHNMISAQLNLVQSGKLSDAQFYENLQKGEIANADLSFEDAKSQMVAQDTGM